MTGCILEAFISVDFIKIYNYSWLQSKLEVDASSSNQPIGMVAVTGDSAANMLQSSARLVSSRSDRGHSTLFSWGWKKTFQQRKMFSHFLFCFWGKLWELVKKCRKKTTEKKQRIQPNNEESSQWDQLPLVAVLGLRCQTNVYFRMEMCVKKALRGKRQREKQTWFLSPK